MKIIVVNGICTQYSEIIVEQECSECEEMGLPNDTLPINACICKGYGIVTRTHTVSNHGWLPLEWWIKEFEGR